MQTRAILVGCCDCRGVDNKEMDNEGGRHAQKQARFFAASYMLSMRALGICMLESSYSIFGPQGS